MEKYGGEGTDSVFEAWVLVRVHVFVPAVCVRQGGRAGGERGRGEGGREGGRDGEIEGVCIVAGDEDT
jgi:hypothetical protein